MDLPITTGQAARLLGTTEPRLAEAVRRGHISPAPPILVGRRLWHREHIEQAAQHIGCLTPGLIDRLADPAPTRPA